MAHPWLISTTTAFWMCTCAIITSHLQTTPPTPCCATWEELIWKLPSRMSRNLQARAIESSNLSNPPGSTLTDGWLDLHVVNDRLFGPDVLYRNNGDGTFQDMASDWGLAVEAYSMSSSFADFDKDQDWDVVSTNGANEGNHFRRVVGQPFVSTSGTAEADLMYEEVASEAGILLSELAWGANWFDADNDGWLDLYIATGTSLIPIFRRSLTCTRIRRTVCS